MNYFLTWLRRTSTFFYLCPRKAEWNYLPSYAGDAPDAGDVVSSKGRFFCPVLSTPPPEADGTNPAAPLPAFPPPGGSPRPFPRGLWEGRWAGPAVPEPQFLLRELAVLLGSSGVGAPPFLQPFAAFELAELSEQKRFDIWGRRGGCLR